MSQRKKEVMHTKSNLICSAI